MALRKKPKTEDEFLGQGAVVPTVDVPVDILKTVDKTVIKFEVRIPVELVEIIDTDRRDGFQKTSRNTWLIDAAVNELKRKGKL
jgi:hypothetical protein